MVLPEKRKMPMAVSEFDTVMVPELEMVPELLMPLLLEPEVDIVMSPELSMVAPKLLRIPSPKPVFPEFDIVMMPALAMVPELVNVPVDVISMVPPAMFVRV